MINYRILGPLEVIRDGERVEPGAGTQRAVLALLLLHANRPVPAARLIDALWDEPPASAGKILQNCVMRLRRMLLEESLLTRNRGYELRVAPDDLDSDRFLRSVAQGSRALHRKDYASALELLDRALAEWRGAPLQDVGDVPLLEQEARRLEGLWLGAVVDRIDAALALGRHGEVVDELERLVREHPLHERLRAQLMLALYRGGRQTESLDVYRAGRRVLVEEVGVEPGPALRQLERQILRQDPALDRPAGKPAGTARLSVGGRRFSILLAALALGALAAFAAVGLIDNQSEAPAAGIPPYSVAVVDPSSGRVTRNLAVGTMPSGIVAAYGAAWVLNQGESTLTMIHARHEQVSVRAMAVGSSTNASVTSIAAADAAVWAVDSASGSLARVPLAAGLIQRFALPPSYRYSSDYLTLAAGAGRLWITSSHFSELFEFDPRRGRVLSRVALPGRAVAAATGRASVWCVTAQDAGAGLAVRLDPATRKVVARVPLPGTPTAVASGFGSVWVSMADRNLVFEIDESTNAVVRAIPVPGSPARIAVGEGGVWVVASAGRRLLRLNPASGATEANITLDGTPHALAIAAGRIWVVLA